MGTIYQPMNDTEAGDTIVASQAFKSWVKGTVVSSAWSQQTRSWESGHRSWEGLMLSSRNVFYLISSWFQFVLMETFEDL